MRLSVLVALGCASCGVIATPGSGDDNLPDARLGPFRTFGEGEVSLPPMVLLDFTAQLGGPEIVRDAEGALSLFVHSAPDDEDVTILRRATGSAPNEVGGLQTVLEPGSGEQSGLRDPCWFATDAGDSMLLYGLGSGERIGVARPDGNGFTRRDEPLLEAADPVAAPIGAPSLVILDGTWLLYTSRGDSIALATSPDGQTFTDAGVVLAPGEEWDAGGVGDPEAVVHVSPLGVRTVRLYYTGVSADDPPERGVGVAASFDGRSAFSGFVGNPLVSLADDEWAPTVAVGQGDEPTLLYFARASGTGRGGVAGAVYPGSVTFAEE